MLQRLRIGFPGRDLIVFVTFCVIFATLVLQGLTLPTLIKWREILRLIYLRQHTDAQQLQAVADPDNEITSIATDDHGTGVLALRREIIDAERRVLLAMRRKGELHDDVLRRLQLELDLEEQRARRDR